MIVPVIIPLLSEIFSSGLVSVVFLPCLGIGLLVAIVYLVRHIITGRD